MLEDHLSALRWSPGGGLPLATTDPRREWLLEPGSLTRKLQTERDGAFRLELIEQVSEPLPHGIAALLDAHAGDPGHRRDVRLHAGAAACIYASSFWPERTERDQAWLESLGERPLGDALFTHPDASRGPIEVAEVIPGDPLMRRIGTSAAPTGSVWARRSVFRIGGAAPLLVHEFFLPVLFGAR